MGDGGLWGGGGYGIKMVGNTRGKLIRVKWTTLFKDGSFNTKLARVAGARVREVERLRARAKEEAEAKLGVELKQTKRELAQIQKQNIICVYITKEFNNIEKNTKNNP